jgi:predicted ATPase
MLVVDRLILRRFRSLHAAAIQFANPTVFVGLNGSGKSNIVDALAFVSDAMRMPLQTAFERRGGIESVRFRAAEKVRPGVLGIAIILRDTENATFRARYAFEVAPRPGYEFSIRREQCRIYDGERAIVWFELASSTMHY